MALVSCAICGQLMDEKDWAMTTLGNLCPSCRTSLEEADRERKPASKQDMRGFWAMIFYAVVLIISWVLGRAHA
jgi:hypothetical protein